MILIPIIILTYILLIPIFSGLIARLTNDDNEGKDFWREPTLSNLGGVFWPITLPSLLIYGLFGIWLEKLILFLYRFTRDVNPWQSWKSYVEKRSS